MSFVLDALKLSEQRRSKFARPVYAHPPRPRPGRRRGRWIAALAAGTAVAGVFLAWRLLIPALPFAADGGSGGAGPAASAAAGAAANAAPGNLPAEDTGPLQPPAPGARAERSGAPDGSGMSASGEPPAARPAESAEMEPVPPPPPEDPPHGMVLATVPPDWPTLTLQMLFHSPQSGRSFVQINGRSYREGEILEDGPEVVAIAADGVILAYEDARVRLAMQR